MPPTAGTTRSRVGAEASRSQGGSLRWSPTGASARQVARPLGAPHKSTAPDRPTSSWTVWRRDAALRRGCRTAAARANRVQEGWGADRDDILRWFCDRGSRRRCPLDDEVWHELATRAVRLRRESGALNVLPLALGYRAPYITLEVRGGDGAGRGKPMRSEATGLVQYSWGLLAAWRGVERTGLDDFSRHFTTRPNGARGSIGRPYFSAVLHNGSADTTPRWRTPSGHVIR
jgi:hypothetical protein